MEIVKKPVPPTATSPATVAPEAVPETTPAAAPGVTTLPKRMFTQPVVRQPVPPVQETVASVTAPEMASEVPVEQAQSFDDGIVQRDPRTGQALASELDQANFEYIGQGDPMRALYQGLVWAAESFKNLARTTPAIAALSPGATTWIDQIATIGYQITNTGAELTRGLWNWPFTRVILNQQIETLMYPEERGIFDKLYKEWLDTFIAPVEAGQAKYDPERMMKWTLGHKEIAEPKAFVGLCSERYTAERIAMKHAWTPTDALSRTMPLGERRKTSTGLESVFRKKPG